jgi:hypothetical protein
MTGMGRFNHSLKNDLKNVLKNREGWFSVFWKQFSIQIPNQKPTRLNYPNSAMVMTRDGTVYP